MLVPSRLCLSSLWHIRTFLVQHTRHGPHTPTSWILVSSVLLHLGLPQLHPSFPSTQLLVPPAHQALADASLALVQLGKSPCYSHLHSTLDHSYIFQARRIAHSVNMHPVLLSSHHRLVGHTEHRPTHQSTHKCQAPHTLHHSHIQFHILAVRSARRSRPWGIYRHFVQYILHHSHRSQAQQLRCQLLPALDPNYRQVCRNWNRSSLGHKCSRP